MASPKITFEVDGADELTRKLRGLGEHVNSEKFLREVLREGAEILQARLQTSAPYLTGQLRDSIEISSGDRDKVSLRVGPSKEGFYGRFLEYGTSDMPARPWMRPEFDASRDEVEAALSEAFWRKVEEYVT